MNHIGERLKEERKRLGFSQAELAGFGGMAANAQVRYEQGDRLPRADYLQALSNAGVDVLYVVTGVREALCAISPEEGEFMYNLRVLEYRDRIAITRVALILSGVLRTS